MNDYQMVIDVARKHANDEQIAKILAQVDKQMGKMKDEEMAVKFLLREYAVRLAFRMEQLGVKFEW